MSLLKISFVSLFPEMFNGFLNSSIIKKAIENNLIEFEIVNFRRFSLDKHHKVDDYQYGGGAGMVLMLQPIVDCIKAIRTNNSIVILTTPKGKLFNQTLALEISKTYNHIILISGHYEGFDERIKNYIDLEISIGDFILTGGELPALTIIDCCVRCINGVLGDFESIDNESFGGINNSRYDYLLEYPLYTQPREWRNRKVPEILLSGNHQKIDEWKLNEAEQITQKRRPDMWKKYKETN